MEDLIDFEDGEDRKINYNHKGTDYVLQSGDPYGFWSIAQKKGGHTPEPLKGIYTALSECKSAIMSYHNTLEFKKTQKVI